MAYLTCSSCILLLSAALLHVLFPYNALAAYAPDLITQLPGQPAPVSFSQYSGYITINSTAGREFFYYFVEAETSPQSSPLTLWFGGGPGCSSIGEAFTGLGPFLSNGDGIIRNNYGWNKYSNMLFVESPVGVGFSYSNTSSDYLNRLSDSTTAEDNLIFLLSWMEKFPEFNGRNLYLAGRTYAGHYVPQMASKVADYMKAFGTSVLNMKAIALGNPALDDSIETDAGWTFLWTHGLISYQTAQLIVYCGTAQSSACNEAQNELLRSGFFKYLNPNDVIADTCITSAARQDMKRKLTNMKMVSNQTSLGMDVCVVDEVPLYLNRLDVKLALHANLPYPWQVCSSVVELKYDIKGAPATMIPMLKTLLIDGLRIFAYSGDQDSNYPFIGTSSMIYHLAKDLALNVTTPYGAWFEGQQVGGWTIGYGSGELTFATVRAAALEVPASQPTRALQLFRSFISGTPLPSSPQA